MVPPVSSGSPSAPSLQFSSAALSAALVLRPASDAHSGTRTAVAAALLETSPIKKQKVSANYFLTTV